MSKFFALAVLIAFAPLQFASAKPANMKGAYVKNAVAKIRVLDKVTARTNEISVKTNEKFSYDNIFISLKKCWKSLPTERDENIAFLEISEEKDVEKQIFLGWMFSSSPSISNLQHPVYDVRLLECKRPSKKKSKKKTS